MQVVIYSSNTDLTSEAIKLNVYDILKKPLDRIEFEFLIKKYKEFKTEEEQQHRNQLTKYESKKANATTIHIATTTSVYIIPLNSIGYCYYDKNANPERWYLVETDYKKVPLKRKTNAETILATSSNFAQINKHLIINRDYLSKIKDCQCIMFYPFNQETMLFKITRRFLELLRKNNVNL
jgi:DNA-binding LytR/AlgR family response regulator